MLSYKMSDLIGKLKQLMDILFHKRKDYDKQDIFQLSADHNLIPIYMYIFAFKLVGYC
jgi:hypothetical protein